MIFWTGSYTSLVGSTVCRTCPDGTVSEKEDGGSTTCLKCQQKDWIPNQNKSKCIRNEFVYELDSSTVYDFSELGKGEMLTYSLYSYDKYINIKFCSPQYHDQCKGQMNVSVIS